MYLFCKLDSIDTYEYDMEILVCVYMTFQLVFRYYGKDINVHHCCLWNLITLNKICLACISDLLDDIKKKEDKKNNIYITITIMKKNE